MTASDRRESFEHPQNAQRPIYYFNLPAPQGDADFKAALIAEVEKCRHCGCSTLIPQLPMDTEIDATTLRTVQGMYEVILKKASELGLSVGFYLDPAFERAVIRTMGEIEEHALRSKLLVCKEYSCERKKTFTRALQKEPRVSLVAFSEETGEIIDLRPFVADSVLTFDVPAGNFVIREYLVVNEMERDGANYLSYDASMGYLRAVFSLFAKTFAPYLGNTLNVVSYSGLGFNGKNRRNWDTSFNDIFEKRFGFDPSPYYPALFGSIGEKTAHVKACFMTVRASLLQNGILHALNDFAAEMGLQTFGNLSEPKLTACSFSAGDAMLNNVYSPCALFDKAYMYGTNSVKIAAGASYNFDLPCVNVELFRNYTRHDKERLYKDAMNAFARGANRTALHLSDELTKDSTFCDFTARIQTLLQGGRHVADIAMLYPIYHLHANSGLYDSVVNGYEYPSTPADADYMTLINSISIYAGHDLTLLHPEVLNTKCHTENGVLYLDNAHNKESFRVVVMPATSIISLENLRTLKKFYDEGGKLLSTGLLPTKAFEFDADGQNDREVCHLIEEIFGHDACNPAVMRDYCHNQNEAGGEAIFLYFNASAADGTYMTRSSTVNAALNSFELPFDIYLPGMPRLECTGAINCVFPEFRTIGLDRTIPGDGMLNHIHKKYEGHELYYFSNTTKATYNHHVLLRGAFAVEEWNPHTGKITERQSKLLSYKGELYTNLRLTLTPCTSAFFYATPITADTAQPEVIESIQHLQSEHAALMSEF